MNSDPIVMKYIGDGSTLNHEQMLKEMEMLTSYYKKRPGMGVWVVELKISSEFVGAGGLTYNTNKAELELGYRLPREQWNKGYATEVCKGTIEICLSKFKSKQSDCFGTRRESSFTQRIGENWNDTDWKWLRVQVSPDLL